MQHACMQHARLYACRHAGMYAGMQVCMTVCIIHGVQVFMTVCIQVHMTVCMQVCRCAGIYDLQFLRKKKKKKLDQQESLIKSMGLNLEKNPILGISEAHVECTSTKKAPIYGVIPLGVCCVCVCVYVCVCVIKMY
jgi:hypothetical protein